MVSLRKVLRKLITLFIFLTPITLSAQILKDPNSLNQVKRGIDYIYNLQFNEAKEVCNKLNEEYPEEPVLYLIKGFATYWENYPMLPDSPARQKLEGDLQKCIDLCDKDHNKEDDAEYLLANLSARGMLLQYYSENGLTMKVIPLATSSYHYIRKAFDFTASYNDFYFFTGLYNYYREAYPEAYPVYKTMAFFFPKGDRAKGLDQLEIVAKNSILYKAESYKFLTYIYLSFENNFEKAYKYSKSLHELYPANMDYFADYIKSALLVKHYDEAESLIKASAYISNPFYTAQLSIFKGILLEKKYQ